MLASERAFGLKLVLVSAGGAEANRALGLTSLILLDERAEVARAFGAMGAPAAVLLDAETKLASDVVFGGEVLRLLETTAATSAAA